MSVERILRRSQTAATACVMSSGVETSLTAFCLTVRDSSTSVGMTKLVSAQELQSKARVEFAAIVLTAAGETRHRATYPPHPPKFLTTIRTLVNKTWGVIFRREGEIVTASFNGDVEIAASVAPFGSVR